MSVGLRQIIDAVYPWLDLRSRGRLHQTARDFRLLNITIYILRNYDVVYSSHSLNQLSQLFSARQRIIALGETHTMDSHRYSNAHLIKWLWSHQAVLAVEGSPETLKGWKSSPDDKGMLTYLPELISERAISWDSDCFDDVLSDYINFTKEAVQATKFLLKFAELKTLTHTHFSGFIVRHFKEPLRSKLLVPSLEVLKQEEAHLSIAQRSFYKKRIYLEMVEALFSFVDSQSDFYDQSIREKNGFRNHSFISKLREMRQAGVQGFLIAGSSHLSDCANIIGEPLSDCLFLKPKNRSIELVKTDLESLFPHHDLAPVIESEPEERVQDDHRAIIENEILTERGIQTLKDSLLELDPSDIDCDRNHFSIWVHTCLNILEWEAQYPSAGKPGKD